MSNEHSDMPGEDAVVPVPIPPLVTILTSLEARKGRRLTEQEVLLARDEAVCMQMSPAAARQMEQARGYADIDLVDTWVAWQRFQQSQET